MSWTTYSRCRWWAGRSIYSGRYSHWCRKQEHRDAWQKLTLAKEERLGRHHSSHYLSFCPQYLLEPWFLQDPLESLLFTHQPLFMNLLLHSHFPQLGPLLVSLFPESSLLEVSSASSTTSSLATVRPSMFSSSLSFALSSLLTYHHFPCFHHQNYYSSTSSPSLWIASFPDSSFSLFSPSEASFISLVRFTKLGFSSHLCLDTEMLFKRWLWPRWRDMDVIHPTILVLIFVTYHNIEGNFLVLITL